MLIQNQLAAYVQILIITFQIHATQLVIPQVAVQHSRLVMFIIILVQVHVVNVQMELDK